MSPLAWILTVTVAGGVASVLAAAVLAFTARAAWVPVLISYAVGALLGAAFLEVLPAAIEASGDAHQATAAVLAGLLVFFVLEKVVLWRHCHDEGCEGHDTHQHGDHGRSGLLILIGDTVHNFVDGVLIAAAFMQSVPLGMVTAVAIIAHEIPQEVGDFLILLHSGYSRTRALAYNLLSGLAMVAGGLLAWLALSGVQQAIPTLLAFASASMIYVAVADLIPGLHRRTEPAAMVQQVLLIGLGLASVGVGHYFVNH